MCIGHIVSEARNAFSCPLNNPFTEKLVKRQEGRFGCEQLILVYLQIMLINLYRDNASCANASACINKNYNKELHACVIAYLETHLNDAISLDFLAAHFAVSRTKLKAVFREHMGMGIVGYLRYLRIERAKQLIRENSMSFTTISEQLGFSSIHYFSRVFKKQAGMSPSEYACSVKALVDTCHTG